MIHVLPRAALLAAVRVVVGAYARFAIPLSPGPQRLYFANHTSHIDTLAILAALPPPLRRLVRPVAARDYWDAGAGRRYIAQKLLNVVLIDRARTATTDPLAPLRAALQNGDSLILFPEGTRGISDTPGPFKSGLFHLAKEFPNVELVPAYLANLNRAMPKGGLIPIPLICRAGFGAPLPRIPDEPKEVFLARARDAVLALKEHV
jgi:1-acyl-sn-glycerol-3-phosphate acyltransferase